MIRQTLTVAAAVLLSAGALPVLTGCSDHASDLQKLRGSQTPTAPGATAAPGGLGAQPGGPVQDPLSGGDPGPGPGRNPTTTNPPGGGDPGPGGDPGDPGAGVCQPNQAAANVQSVWRPPSQRRAVCTRNDALTILACVFDGQGCQNPVQDECRRCIITSKQQSPTYGPIILDEQTQQPELNVEGCVAALSGDITQNGCGGRVKLQYECEELACSQCADDNSRGACIQQADQTAACGQAFANAQPCQQYVSQCMQGGDIGQVAINLTAYFCGAN